MTNLPSLPRNSVMAGLCFCAAILIIVYVVSQTNKTPSETTQTKKVNLTQKQKETESKKPEPKPSFAKFRPHVNRDNYLQLKLGMTLDKVEVLLGGEADKESVTMIGDLCSVHRIWRCETKKGNTRMVSLHFDRVFGNDYLSRISQFDINEE